MTPASRGRVTGALPEALGAVVICTALLVALAVASQIIAWAANPPTRDIAVLATVTLVAGTVASYTIRDAADWVAKSILPVPQGESA